MISTFKRTESVTKFSFLKGWELASKWGGRRVLSEGNGGEKKV